MTRKWKWRGRTENMAVARDSLVSFERVIKSAFVKSQAGNESYIKVTNVTNK